MIKVFNGFVELDHTDIMNEATGKSKVYPKTT